MKRVPTAFALLALVQLVLLRASFAQGPVACIVSGLDGDVLLKREAGQPQSLTKYKKLLAGDSVELPKGAFLRLSYLPLGKAEDWQGPATLKIQPHEALDLESAQKPVVVSLGVDVASIKESPLLREQKELVSGQFNVRTLNAGKGADSGPGARKPADAPLDGAQRKELENLKRQYALLMKKMPAGDATPHLYYLAGLQRLDRWSDPWRRRCSGQPSSQQQRPSSSAAAP